MPKHKWIFNQGNRIEARQWIVARHLSCYNPLSCFTPQNGVKYDKIKFHDFFVFVIFFFLPYLSLSFSPVSLSHPVFLYISLEPRSLPFFLPLMVSSYLSLSHPAFLYIFFSRCLSPTIVFLSSFSLPSLSLSL